jgi:hypothetical protein
MEAYRLCSSCKKPIAFEAVYFACSVSTCNRKRTGLYFCSVGCWDAHLPEARHREAWAEERRAPTREAAAREDAAPEPEPRRIVVAPAPPAAAAARPPAAVPSEVLVVVSKLKGYIRAASGMNTSDNVVDVLSDHLRHLCDEAARNAARDGRKTVLDRDFIPLLRP